VWSLDVRDRFLKTDGGLAGPIDREIRFGRFCLRPAQQLLLEADVPVRIGARALDLLIALVERAGEVVSRDELVARVWAGLAVEEGNLRTQMALARKILHDGEDGARYVITVPGRGYSFVAPVTSSEPINLTRPQAPPIKVAPNLPVRLTQLIGREDAVKNIVGRIARHRFSTIVGPGGIGKTSVALAVAQHASASYDDGICLVDCAPLLGTSLVARKLAATLGLEIATDDPTRGLIAFLRTKRMLIILDSCERVVEAAAVLAESLLRGAIGVDILATSREPLRAEGEVVYRLPPLEIPLPSAHLTAADALTYPTVQLFVERAASSADGFELSDIDAPVVASICRKLDGIPLAIELAAGRVDVFGLHGVSARLDDRVRLLSHGRRTALPRHQTLAATLDWSYEVLPEPEQAVLRRLAVFAGSFTLDAAVDVAADDGIAASPQIVEVVASLVLKSLLSADVRTATGLYRLLDTTRAYASQKLLESGEFGQVARRHAKHIRHLLERDSIEATTSSRAMWMSADSAHIDEVRTAIDWAFLAGGDTEIGIALTVASVPLWSYLSLNGECRRHVERALLAGKGSFGRNDHREMQLLAALGAALIYTKGPGPEVDAAWTKALRIAKSLNDADYQVRILWGSWSNHFNTGQYRVALNIAEKLREVAEKSGDTAAALVGERMVGMSLFYLGDHINALIHTESMLRHYVRPTDRSHIIRFQFDQRIVARIVRAKLLWAQGFPDQAMREITGLVEEATEVDHAMSLALALAQGASPLALLSGDWAAAERFIKWLLEHSAAHALDLWHVWGKCFGAILLDIRGSTIEGLDELRRALDELPPYMRYPGLQGTLAEALGRVGEVSSALATIDEVLARSERDDERWYVAEFLRIKGELLLLENKPGATNEAEEQFQRSLDWARRQQALSWELRTSMSLARLYQAKGQIIEAHDVVSAIYSRFEEGFQTADLIAAKSLIDALSLLVK
jgi:predicted ATPase/DNA-binding winged helix-turn-helix (wHTH) protein